MRHKDPELMKKIHDFAEEYYFSEGYSPSTSEIASAVRIARTTAYNYLVAMDKLDMIDYDGKLIATERMRKSGEINHGVGIYDAAIPCGELETIELTSSMRHSGGRSLRKQQYIMTAESFLNSLMEQILKFSSFNEEHSPTCD